MDADARSDAEQARRAWLASLPLESLLLQAVEDSEAAVSSAAAWHWLVAYTHAAKLQLLRFREACAVWDASPQPWPQDVTARPFTELHFYFIAFARILKSLNLLQRVSRLGVRLSKPERELVESYGKDARDFLEHVDERLPGRKAYSGAKGQASMTNPSDYGNVSDEEYTFGGRRWDLSDRPIRRVEAIVADFEEQIRVTATERLLEKARVRPQGQAGENPTT